MNQFQVMFGVGKFGNVVKVFANDQADAMKTVKSLYPDAEIREVLWVNAHY